MTDNEEPVREILTASYRALCRHGNADLALGDVAAHVEARLIADASSNHARATGVTT